MASNYFNQRDLKKSVLKEEWLQNKIKAIIEDATVKNFPDTQPTIEWAGNVIDLLELLGLDVH
ncbi:hypothetical protein [Polaribacter sp. R77954]|uniref:hypothetical protein n=1 Tax=Polaribacter sp. R77954 TaxID=3093870 RepID=UPI0037CAB58D